MQMAMRKPQTPKSLADGFLLVFSFFHRRPRWALCHVAGRCGRCLGPCGLGRRVCGYGLRRAVGLLVLLLFDVVLGNLFDVAVLVLVLEWCEALLALWLCFAVCLCGELGDFLLLLCDLLLLDVLGCLFGVSM